MTTAPVPTPRLRLIVNADDFGATLPINHGIIEAHLEGVVTSASLMVNGQAFDHAIKIARDCHRLDLGLHLTLVGEAPVLPPTQVPSLCGSDGRFLPSAGAFVRRYFANAISLTEVAAELDAQIARALAAGVTLSHIDGHQHLHALPRIRSLVAELGGNFGIRAMRLPREAIRRYMLARLSPVRLASLVVLNALCQLGSAKTLVHPDAFAGFYFGGQLDKRNLLTVIGNLPMTGTCELMCHPGFSDPSSPYSAWRYRWSDEKAALTDPEVRNMIATRNIELISYKDLVNPATETADHP